MVNICKGCEWALKAEPFCQCVVDTNDEDACGKLDSCGNDIYGDDGGPDNAWGCEYGM